MTRRRATRSPTRRASQPTRLCAVHEDGGESVFETSEILERGGAYAFLNPLEGKFLYRR
jgi:hypothetical protein